MAAPAPWANRITRHADVDPSTLDANPANWRRHPKRQADALAGALSEVGYVQSVIVNEQSGRIVDGHLRVQLAVDRGEPSIPVVYVDLSDAEERLILATLDPLAAMAETDDEALRELLGSVTSDDEGVRRLVSFLARETDDPVDEWQGMPEVGQEDLRPARQLLVYFASDADFTAFGELTGLALTASAKWRWYPPRTEQRMVFEDAGE